MLDVLHANRQNDRDARRHPDSSFYLLLRNDLFEREAVTGRINLAVRQAERFRDLARLDVFQIAGSEPDDVGIGHGASRCRTAIALRGDDRDDLVEGFDDLLRCRVFAEGLEFDVRFVRHFDFPFGFEVIVIDHSPIVP